ncbi:DUF1295 domain-containing protein [Terrarubrum flagellatum]|uniref:DUF1295 domain-containing protein n=1 Tax=Terrirubrum flagellatum TaxID=2895980 RepID=UPI0031453C56
MVSLVNAALALLLAVIALCIVMESATLAQRATGKFGWADVFWTFGVGAIAAALALAPAPDALFARQALVAALAIIWALRLGFHIASRLKGGADDPRYVKLHREWGDRASVRMFLFLQAQALGGAPLLLAVLLASRATPERLTFQDFAGAAIGILAIAGEAAADFQLKNFGRDPDNRGMVCDRGLWAWSRHPNYFFEWLGWFAYPVIAIQAGSGAWSWLALLAPIAIYYFLVNVSGVPPLEQHMLVSRGDAYRAYQARTSAFFPLPPRARNSR